MTIGNHLEQFAGVPVRDYDADVGIAARAAVSSHSSRTVMRAFAKVNRRVTQRL